MRRRKTKLFNLVVVDHDRGIFNVVGPMSDDTGWIDSVVSCQAKGRRVNCFTPREGLTRAAVVALYAAQSGYRRVEDPVV